MAISDISHQCLLRNSCYLTVQDCQLAIILIGKRYGSISANGRSVTHNEFITARSKSVPVICLVDREIITFKRIYDANISTDNMPSFPGMDDPQKTFEFINDFINSPVNNGFLEFGDVSEVRSHLKKQLAHLFGELLRNRFDPLKVEVQDVLSEIKTLRYELLKDTKSSYQPILNSFRFILADENHHFGKNLECLFDSREEAVPPLIESKTFDDLVAKSGLEIEIVDNLFDKNGLDKKTFTEEEKILVSLDDDIIDDNEIRYKCVTRLNEFRDHFKEDEAPLAFACSKHKLWLNEIGKKYFDLKFEQFKQATATKDKRR